MSEYSQYEEYIRKINNKDIRNLVTESLDIVPVYFFSLKASTSGKHHGGETLLRHVLDCADMLLNYSSRSLSRFWTQHDMDIALAAILLHDCWRCGYPGSETRDPLTKELCTSPLHPRVATNMLSRIFQSGVYKKEEPDYLSDTKRSILRAIDWHYGPWTTWYSEEEVKKFMKLPYTDVAMQVFLIDSANAWNRSQLRNRSKEDYPLLFLE